MSTTQAPPAGLKAGQQWSDGPRRMIAVEIAGGELVSMEMVQQIPTEAIVRSPMNRKHFDPAKAKELHDSIREQGQVTPAIVRPAPLFTFELVAGERRWQACKGLCVPLLCVVRDYSASEAAEILILENLEREDLRPMDEATMYQSLLQLRDASGAKLYTIEKIAQRVHGDAKKTSRVGRVLKLLDLPAAVSKALDEGTVSLRVAFEVARVADKKDREAFGKLALSDQYTAAPMTVKRAQQVARDYQVNLKGADFDRSKWDLLDARKKEAFGFDGEEGEKNDGSCDRCPFLAKNNPAFADELASGSKGGNESGIDALTCTRPKCAAAKRNAAWHLKAEPFAKAHGSLNILDVETKIFDFDGTSSFSAKEVALDEKPSRWHTNDYDAAQKAPKWAKILKGSTVPLLVARGPEGEPVLVADKALAITAAKVSHPGLFAKAEVPGTTNSKREQTPEEKAASAEAKRLADLEAAIKDETERDCLLELRQRVAAKGLGLDGFKLLFEAMLRCIDGNENLGRTLLGRWTAEHEKLGIEDAEHLLRSQAHQPGLTITDLQALCVMAAVCDDVSYSGAHKAEDFQKFCKAAGIKTQDIEKRVRKAHELADAAMKKIVAADAKKAAAGKVNDGMMTGTGHSGAPAKVVEQLFTCPKCGQENFTAKGLKSHNCAKRAGAKKVDDRDDLESSPVLDIVNRKRRSAGLPPLTAAEGRAAYAGGIKGLIKGQGELVFAGEATAIDAQDDDAAPGPVTVAEVSAAGDLEKAWAALKKPGTAASAKDKKAWDAKRKALSRAAKKAGITLS